MFLQVSSLGDYSAKTCHERGEGSRTLGASFLLLVVECVGSWPAWIKGSLIKGSLVVPQNHIFVLNMFRAYLFYVTESLISAVIIQSSHFLHTRLGKQWADLAIPSSSFISLAKI